MCKQNLTSNNLKWLICRKTKPNLSKNYGICILKDIHLRYIFSKKLSSSFIIMVYP